MNYKLGIRNYRLGGGFLLLFLLILFFLPFLFPSCASIGNPNGGDFDTIPPVFVKSKPAPNSINYRGNKIELYFDEYINIEKPAEKVIITPPQFKMPVIKSIGKKIEIELKDSLISNTTYTIDFTNGIVDNNEKNPIDGFTFAFSTGDVIDSLVVSGLLLNAENLEPMPNIIVGLHSNLEDSAFTTQPFIRTSMTNDRGRFWIRNVAPGTYRLYALNDQNRNFIFDQDKEDLALYDSLITPDFFSSIRIDTTLINNLIVDTIKVISYNRFIPDDIIMFLFKESTYKQYLSKSERPMDRQLIFHFNSAIVLPPTINLLGDDSSNDFSASWFISEYSNDKKDITYWVTDSLIYKQDTIKVEAIYQISDSLNNLILFTDTINFPWRNRDNTNKDSRNESKERTDILKIEWNAKSIMDVYDTLKISFSEPVIDFDFDKIQIQQKVDTLWENKKFSIIRDTLNPRLFFVDHKWYYEQEFRIIVDSSAIYSTYGNWNDLISTTFRFNSEKEYGNLYVKIFGGEGPGFGELLDNSERVVRRSVLENGELIFEDLKPGDYFLRYIEDTNGNRKWDTGNYAEHLQPEKVYYYNALIPITKYGSHEQEWNIMQLPIEDQKPLDITKNKPVERQQRINNQRNQNRQQNTGGSNQFGGRSLPGFGGRSIPGM